MRRKHKLHVVVNGCPFNEVIIDPHFEEKHFKSINDVLILSLVKALNSRELEPQIVSSDGFEYFMTEPMYYKRKPYRLIWLIDPDKTYIGVVNCYRRPKK